MADFIWLRIEEKGKRGQAIRRVIRLPIVQRAVAGHESAVPRVAELLRRYFRARKRASPAVPEFAFQLAGEARPTLRQATRRARRRARRPALTSTSQSARR